MKNFAIIIICDKKDGRSRLNKTLMSNTQNVICDFYNAKGEAVIIFSISSMRVMASK